jgi:acyl-CoA synthetase (AMP-forming)/AMP-acid ligase II/3-hydroxymyristoyl/3-hydroxydecanoyl-(acyl carrier protein) dehydratase
VSYRLVPEGADSRIVAWVQDAERARPVPLKEMLGRAAWLGDRVRQAGVEEWVLISEDAHLVQLALLGVWGARGRVILPAASTPEALREILGERTRGLLLDGRFASELSPEVPPGQLVDLSALSARCVASSGKDQPAADLLKALVLRADEPLLTLYTSGSTGFPKAVSKTAQQLLGEAQLLAGLFLSADTTGGARATAASIGEDPNTSAVLCGVSPLHIYGLLLGVLAPLAAQRAVIGRFGGHPAGWRAERVHASMLVSAPAQLEAWLSSDPGLLSAAQCVFSSAAPLSLSVFEALSVRHGLRVIELLGSTETGGIAYRSGDPAGPWRCLPGVQVSAGQDGEMLLSSPFLSADSRTPLVCPDQIAMVDGGFVHLGRSDDVVKIAGKRVSTEELTAVARRLPGVDDVVTIARPGGGLRGNELWMIVACEEDSALTPRSLRRALLRRFHPVVIPRRFRFVRALPRSERGKLRRQDLLALLEEGAPTPRRHGDPRAALAHPRPLAIDIPIPQQLPGGRAVIEYRMRLEPDHPWFHGHFPGWPILAGVIQLQELVLRPAELAWPELAAPHLLERLKFSSPVEPGDELSVSLCLVPEGQRGRRLTFLITHVDRPEPAVAKGWFRFDIRPETGAGAL